MVRFRLVGFLLLLVGLTAIPARDRVAHALPGNVLGEQKVSDLAGGFGGALDNGDFFGAAVAHLTDLNGDTIDDLTVGAYRDDDGGTNRGAAWILFMAANGTVQSQAKISDTAGGLAATLDDEDSFGFATASLGDLDGDSVTDLAVGAAGDDDGGTDRGAVYILFLNADGTVKDQQKISDTAGGFGGVLDNGDGFGSALAALGDLDGDNIVDLAVGAPADDDGGTDRGAVHILFLDTDGTVKSEAKLSDTTAGFAGSLSNGNNFGSAVGALGDLDGDSVTDLAVGTPSDGDGGPTRGAVWVVFLDATGGVQGSQKISATAGSFTGVLDDGDMFGSSVAKLTDLDGDGITDLAVGAIADDQGGPDRGQIWILFLNADGTVDTFRRINVAGSGFVGPLADGDFFGSAGISPRDLDGDGIVDLVVGARRDDDGGSNRGAIWVLFLDGVPGALCGDDILDPGEDCDDGNTANGDCCDASCQFEVNGASCSDANVCNGAETCNGAAACLPGAPLDCDDSMACTQDTCHPVTGCSSTSGPATVCMLAGKRSISLGDRSPDAKDKLSWKWVKGEETLYTDFGNPQSTDSYTLCIYDEAAGVPALKAELTVPNGPNWTTNGTKVWSYKDSSAINAGVRSVKLVAGAANKAKVILKAKGDQLGAELPGPVGANYFNQDGDVTIQLINSLDFCWTTDFATPALTNETDSFKDKFP